MVLSSLQDSALLNVFLWLLLGYRIGIVSCVNLMTRREEAAIYFLLVVGSLGFSVEMSGEPK